MEIRLSREKFFIASIIVVIIFWGINRLTIISESNFANGVVIDQRCWGSRMSYCNPIIYFKHQTDSIVFEGETDLDVFTGDSVTVIYRNNNANNAEVWSFGGFWGISIIISIFIILLLNAIVFSFIKNRSVLIITIPKLWDRTKKATHATNNKQIKQSKTK